MPRLLPAEPHLFGVVTRPSPQAAGTKGTAHQSAVGLGALQAKVFGALSLEHWLSRLQERQAQAVEGLKRPEGSWVTANQSEVLGWGGGASEAEGQGMGLGGNPSSRF